MAASSRKGLHRRMPVMGARVIHLLVYHAGQWARQRCMRSAFIDGPAFGSAPLRGFACPVFSFVSL
jgi:hypothetical protein